MPPAPRILFCNCTYAQVVDPVVKAAVLKRLCESALPFEAVADLCEMSARHDPVLKQLAGSESLKIAACFPRAVKGLFHYAQAALSSEATEILNMRTHGADEICDALFNSDLRPNVPMHMDSAPAVSR